MSRANCPAFLFRGRLMHLIFIGYPGSGKGTVAKQLKDYKQISVGDLLRKEIESGSDLGKEIDFLIGSGSLVSDEIALKSIINNFIPNQKYIFDGFPRTLKQAKMLDEQVLKGEKFKVVHFDIDKSFLIDRIVNRRTCPNCGAIYNLKFNPPKKQNTCNDCGHTTLNHRKDDTLDVLQKRFDIFESTSPEILKFYKDNLCVVDGSLETPLIISKIMLDI